MIFNSPSTRQVPDRLFRYRPLTTGDDVKRLLASLRDGSIWASEYRRLNDPMEAHFEAAIPDRTVVGLGSRLQQSRAIEDAVHNMIFSTGTISFSSSSNSFPLWAYYGSSFSGVCIEYESSALLNADLVNEIILPIDYQDRPLPALDATKLHAMGAAAWSIALLSRKHHSWSGEDEWRIICSSPGEKRFPREAITSIYLGPRIDPRHEKQICSALSDTATQIFQYQIKSGSYSMIEVGEDRRSYEDRAMRVLRAKHHLVDMDEVNSYHPGFIDYVGGWPKARQILQHITESPTFLEFRGFGICSDMDAAFIDAWYTFPTRGIQPYRRFHVDRSGTIVSPSRMTFSGSIRVGSPLIHLENAALIYDPSFQDWKESFAKEYASILSSSGT